MHYPYQDQANALPGSVVRSEVAAQGYDPNMWPYQAQANVQIDRVVDSYDIPQNHQVVAPMARNWGVATAGSGVEHESCQPGPSAAKKFGIPRTPIGGAAPLARRPRKPRV